MCTLRCLIILLLVFDVSWSYTEVDSADHFMCAGGTIRRMRNGDINCCITLEGRKTECFIVDKDSKETQRKSLLDGRLEVWQHDMMCQDGIQYVSGNQMFCCREDDGGPLDKLCDIVPYKVNPKHKAANQNKNNNFAKINDNKPELCYLPPVDAMYSCLAYIERYFYNSALDKCEHFIYGGCKGTENNFETLEACTAACMTESLQ